MPSFAWNENNMNYRRAILNTSTSMDGFILPLNTTFSDVDSNGLDELYYGVYTNGGYLYYNDENYTVYGNSTNTYFHFQTFPQIYINGTAPTSKDLIAYLPFDDSGNTQWDYTHNYNGTVQGSASTRQTGQVGYGISFDNSGNQYVTLPDIDLDNITVMLWVNLDAVDNYDHFIADWEAGGARSFALGLNGTGNGLAFSILEGAAKTDLEDNTFHIATGNWYHVTATYDSETMRIYANGDEIASDGTPSGGLDDTNNLIGIGRDANVGVGNGGPVEGTIDDVRIYSQALSATDIQALYNASLYTYLGSQETSLSMSFNPSPSVVNVNVNTSITASGLFNLTQFWWDVDNGNTSYYTTENYIIHNYTSADAYVVNATAYDANSASNQSLSETLIVNDILSSATIQINNYLPFIFETPSEYINYTTSDGSGVFNSSWTFTLPSGTNETFTNQTNLSYTFDESGQTVVNLRVCDMADSTCATDTDSFKPWNITGGVHLFNIFNTSSNLISQAFLGSQITLSSSDSINWTLKSITTTGTSKVVTLNSTNSFFDDVNNYYYNLTASISWENYTAQNYVTLAAANYSVSQSNSCTSNLYCLVGGVVEDELNTTDTFSSAEYGGTISTSYYYGHSRDWSSSASDLQLNLTMCVNATPIISNLFLDGTLTYTGSSPSEPDHDTRTYSWNNASIDLSYPCTVVNNVPINYYTFYTIPTGLSNNVTTTVLRSGSTLSDALVKFQSYVNGNWVTVASQITDGNGQVQMPLQLCNTYYKQLVEKDGEVLYNNKDCIKDDGFEPVSHVIEIFSELPEFYKVIDNVYTSCAYNEVTEVFACSITDTSGLSESSRLVVNRLATSTEVCDESEASTSTTLVCDLSDYSTGAFSYTLTINENIVGTGTFDISDIETIGEFGPIIMTFVIVVVGIATAFNPLVGIGSILIVVLGARAMNLTNLTSITVGYITSFCIVALYKVYQWNR